MTAETPDYPIQGCWNGYVESGATKDERRARLGQCPDSLRAGVLSHLKTVAALRETKRLRAMRARMEAA